MLNTTKLLLAGTMSLLFISTSFAAGDFHDTSVVQPKILVSHSSSGICGEYGNNKDKYCYPLYNTMPLKLANKKALFIQYDADGNDFSGLLTQGENAAYVSNSPIHNTRLIVTTVTILGQDSVFRASYAPNKMIYDGFLKGPNKIGLDCNQNGCAAASNGN